MIQQTLDEITNVFTAGRMGFSLFADSDEAVEYWPLSPAHYAVLRTATAPDRAARYPSLAAFVRAWQAAAS